MYTDEEGCSQIVGEEIGIVSVHMYKETRNWTSIFLCTIRK